MSLHSESSKYEVCIRIYFNFPFRALLNLSCSSFPFVLFTIFRALLFLLDLGCTFVTLLHCWLSYPMKLSFLINSIVCLGSHLGYGSRLQSFLDGELVKTGNSGSINIDRYSFPAAFEWMNLPHINYYTDDNFDNLANAVELLEYAKENHVFGDYLYLWNFINCKGDELEATLDSMSLLGQTLSELSPEVLISLIFSTSNSKLRTFYIEIQTGTDKEVNEVNESEGRISYQFLDQAAEPF